MAATLTFGYTGKLCENFRVKLRETRLINMPNYYFSLHVAELTEVSFITGEIPTYDDFWLFCINNADFMGNVYCIYFDKRIHENPYIKYFYDLLSKNIMFEMSNHERCSITLNGYAISQPVCNKSLSFSKFLQLLSGIKNVRAYNRDKIQRKIVYCKTDLCIGLICIIAKYAG